MRSLASLRMLFVTAFVVMFVSIFATAQYGQVDQGQYQILSARYGTERNNVDVTARLKELARQDVTFRMGNSTFGIDPDPGVVKTLRIYARGPRGENRTFEYREGSTIDGSVFTDWRSGGWGNQGGNWGWNGGDEGQYRIVHARYGTPRNNVDVTRRLRELARQDVTFRMGNSTFGIDPDPGVVKMLRIFARGPRGETRTFEYREGSTIDGSLFSGWGRGDWGNERWNGGWGDRDDDQGRFDNGRGNAGTLTVVQALYGAGRNRRDVTSRLQSYVRDGRLELTVNNDTMGGDPAPNMKKYLNVTYSMGGRGGQRQASVNENGRLSIP